MLFLESLQHSLLCKHIGLCIKTELIPHCETHRLSICHGFALGKGFRHCGLYQRTADSWQNLLPFISVSETVNKSVIHHCWISDHTPKC